MAIISDWLLEKGFLTRDEADDYNRVMRIHDLHYLFWSENLRHFAIGVINSIGKRDPGGAFKKWNIVMIPKPVYTIDQAECLLKGIL